MEENTELEEGEACYFKDDEDNIDLDSLSYIDERIQLVLGHFHKDFEGGVSAENLGAKFGGYGSFLPTYERSLFQSHPKTPQRYYSSPKSPGNPLMEAASHNSKAPLNVPPSMRLGTASHSAHSFHNLKVPSVVNSVKKGTGIYSGAINEKCTLKDDCTNKSGNSTDQRTLKLRIKMKSDILAQKNAAIYSGLGLDNSSSSSMGNSPEESEGMPPVSQETPEEYPTGIIQAMTSFCIPGGLLLSPLHDSLLYLIRKEKVLADSRPISSLNGHQEVCSMSTDESDSFLGDGHLLEKRKVRIVGQSEKQLELKHMNGNYSETDMTLHMKKRLGNKTPDRKDFLSNDLRCTPLSSSICDAGEAAEVSGKAFEISKEVNKDGIKCRMISTEPVKEESLESKSGQDFYKIERQNRGNSSMKNVVGHKLQNSHKDNSAEPKNKGKYNSYVISRKDERHAIKCKLDQDPQKHETNQKGKATSEGNNKSKGTSGQSFGKAVTIAKKESFEASSNAGITDKESAGFGVTSCKIKMHKPKSLKDNKVRFKRDSLKEKKSEWKVDKIDPVDGPPGLRAIINADLDNVEEQSARFKVKDRPSGNKVVNQLQAGPCVKDASGAFPIAENKSALEMVPVAAAVPQLIAEDWVCCDSCQKWRLLPTGIKPEQLPEKWLCSMLSWLPGMNRCNISEEKTTKALYTLYQMPFSEGQNNMQSHATGTAIGVSSADGLQFGLNHKNSSFDVVSDRGKKKHGIKEKTTAGINNDMLLSSNTAKNNAQESGKYRSLNDTYQHPTDSNPMKKSSFKHLGRLNNLIEEKSVPKEKGKQMNGGGRKHIKLKHKMEADQYRSGTPKKSKTEVVSYADTQLSPGMDLEKVSINSRNGLPTKASGKYMSKYVEHCLSDDVKDKLVVPVNKGDQAQLSSDGGSFDVANSIKNDGSIKKRKLKGSLDNEKHNNSFSLQGDKQCGEEGNASGFRKEKKYRVSNTEAKPATEGDDKLNREGGVRRVFLSNSRDQMAVGTEVKSGDKAQQPRKHRKNIASHKVLDGFDPLGKDLGSGQLLLAATSSSSKVSGCHKARTNLEDVRGSPVESVTSSPLRTSNLDKRILAAGDTSGKDDARKGGVSSMSSRSLDNKEGKLSVKMKERISYDLHPASHKISSIEYDIEDVKDKARVQAKNSSEVKHDHLLDGGVDTVEQHGHCANGSDHEEKVNKNNQESSLSWQKSGKVTSLSVNEKDRTSGSEIVRDKMKVLASENGYSKKGGSYESAVDPSYHAYGPETKNGAKYSSAKCKHKIDNLSKKNSLRHWSSESGKQTELKQKDFENSVLKVDAAHRTNRKIISQQNLIQDSEEQNKANLICSRVGNSKVISSSEGEAKWKAKRETLYVGFRTAPGSQKGDISNGHLVHASGNGDTAKLMRNSADVRSKAGVNRSSGNFALDGQLFVSSPMKTNSSQTAFKILEEATKLKDKADYYKNSGFEFESNETYFEASLKFLHGASLLESCHSESSKHGEMSQMQIYATAAKIFESCAHEYERRQEMVAAALAYKCMEVAYMRVVYCKHSSIKRDRHELQSTLQMVSQGESPSSSASDVDNLNNLAAVDKATLPKGTSSHGAINQVISARHRSNFVWILDLIQDVNFAMEASRKCQSTFMAANVIMEEARNRDCITSISSVINFSFQDVDEFVRLVWLATKAISGAGLGGARD